MRRIAVLIVAAVSLSGCALSAPPVATQAPEKNTRPGPSPEGRLSIMSGGLNFDLNNPPKDWLIATSDDKVNASAVFSPLTTVTRNGVPTLEVRTGPAQSIAVRRINAMLMATPYLNWAWNLSDHGAGIHPVRLIIGFKGGGSEKNTLKEQLNGLPAHDRALTLVWGDSALRRGTLTRPDKNRPFEAAVYTVRGGRENTRKWWRDTVDLSDLYKQAWPDDERRAIRITFIGIAAAPRMPPVRGRVSGIELSH
ncbi:MAG: hypothetical protein COB46_02020 [Rhodospirillaceae bacterium]|nr:MAG: hypothetical protein COB46_02020 [Rhodospirillaceae bacterium]